MTVSLKIFGCRLNQAEAAAFAEAFAAAGAACVPFGKPSDVVVLHTCAVTQSAEDECLKLLRSLRRKWPSAFLVMAGCAVESAAVEKLAAAGADLVVARGDKERLAELVLEKSGARAPSPAVVLSEVQMPVSAQRARAPALPTGPVRRKRALLKVQDGCDFRCTYCIVPHVRGLPRSRPFGECLREAEAFIARGHREIVVTGCNLACYTDGARRLVDLLAALAALPGLGRLRLGSLEPGTVEGEVAAFMASSEKVCKFLHLPVQSGDDGVLARMGRRYTAAQLEEAVLHAQALMPDAAFGADFICGFPGETEAAFGRTLRLAEALPFSNFHVFSYSERPGTPACGFDGSVPAEERRARANRLIALGREKRAAFAERFAGRRVEMLVERIDGAGRACGWSGEYLPCEVAGVPRGAVGSLCVFTPDRAEGGTLSGALPEAGGKSGVNPRTASVSV